MASLHASVQRLVGYGESREQILESIRLDATARKAFLESGQIGSNEDIEVELILNAPVSKHERKLLKEKAEAMLREVWDISVKQVVIPRLNDVTSGIARVARFDQEVGRTLSDNLISLLKTYIDIIQASRENIFGKVGEDELSRSRKFRSASENVAPPHMFYSHDALNRAGHQTSPADHGRSNPWTIMVAAGLPAPRQGAPSEVPSTVLALIWYHIGREGSARGWQKWPARPTPLVPQDGELNMPTRSTGDIDAFVAVAIDEDLTRERLLRRIGQIKAALKVAESEGRGDRATELKEELNLTRGEVQRLN